MPITREKWISPALAGISLLGVYICTLAPGLTWANGGADGGDLISAAATGGVAHPTGYPTYLLLARAFQALPFGSLAFRTNLMSALAAAAASMLVYGVVTRCLPSENRNRWLAGLAAAYAFGLAPLVWSQAVITEVYALQAFFLALLLYLSTVPNRWKAKHLDGALGLAFGLAMGNHVTTILMLPVILFSNIPPSDRPEGSRRFLGSLRFDGHSLPSNSLRAGLRRLAWMGLGLLIYLSLPLRAMSGPEVNWGNPVTWENFRWLVSGQLYHEELFTLSLPLAWARIQSTAALLLEQFGLPGLALGLTGLVFFFTPSAVSRNTLWMLAAFSVFAIGYGTYDSYVYLIPSAMGFAVWIGLGLNGLMGEVARRFPRAGLALGLAFLACVLAAAGGHWQGADASRDLRAEQFGRAVLEQAPADAIVFAQGDQAVFSLWYFHYALRERADLVVVATDLLGFDWYQEMLGRNYPSLALVGPYPFPSTLIAANPERPVCYVEYYEQGMINCVP